MRKALIAVLLVVLFSVPVFAIQPRVAYLGDITSIAWMDGGTLNVALANNSNTRSTITISTDTWDSRWRPVFSERTVTVPGRTIVAVSIKPSEPRRGESINVKISEFRRSVEVPIQAGSIFNAKSFVVPANTRLSFDIDLGFMLGEPRLDRLVVDKFYEGVGSRARGPIEVESVEGGLRYVPSRNSIEYTAPKMVLSMRTPQTNGLEVITFSLSKEYSGYRGGAEEVPGPTILVYGRNFRFTSTAAADPKDDTRVQR
jgi:hypothetical protein